MTAHKHLKQLVRARMARTSESYATARRQVIRQAPQKTTDPATRWHFPGNIPAPTALRVLLAHAGWELSEAMVFGLAGGIGAGVFSFLYEKEDFASFFIAGRHSWQDDKAYLLDACQRLAVEATLKESSGAKPGEKHLRELLERGPVIAWIDMGTLPHRAMPAYTSGGGYHVVTIYKIDDKSALIGDLTDEPIAIPLADLASARGRIKKFKNRLLAFDAPKKQPALADLVKSGLHACHQMLATCKMKNFTLEAFRVWGERMHGGKDKESWQRVFTPGHRLWRGLTSVHDFIENYGTGGGLCRPMFGEFLSEAAGATKDLRLSDLGTQYADLGQGWSELASAALPENVPMFKQARELFTQRNELAASGDAVDQLRATWLEIEDLHAQAKTKFPLTPAECDELRRSLKGRILELYEGEVAAHNKLGEIVS